MWTHSIGLFILVSTLCGCETLASERSANLAVGVGEDVQLNINPPVAVFSVGWYFGSVDRFILTWNGVSENVNPPYQGRIELNKNTGTLTLKNVTRSDSGHYLYQAVSTATGNPVQYNGSIALTVYPANSGSLTPGEIAGIVIGTLAGVALIGVTVYFCLKKYGNGTKTPKSSPPGNKSPAAAVNANDKADNIHYADPKFLKNNKSGQRIQMEETTTEYAQVAGQPAGNQRQPPLEPNTEYAQVAGRPAGKNRPAV